LEGKTTAQSITTNYAKLAREAGAKIQGVEGFAQAAALLTQGRVDAVINDNIAVLDYLNTTGSDAIEIAGFAGTEQNLQSLAFRRADADLRRQADAALKELAADGTLAKISQRYFKADVSRADGGDVDLSGGDRGSSTTDRLRDAAGPMFKGLLVATIPITILSFAIGLVIAVAAALARVSGIRVLDYLARAYISLIRGTPLLLQLFIVFYGLPEIGVTLGSWPSAVIALSINVGAYAAEIVRSAILAVPRGQFEAASSIGMTYRQSLRRIILPQAARTAVPPLSNTLISLLKDTSLLSVVLVTELTREAQYAASASGDYLALYAFAGLYYWVVCTVASFGQSRLEARMNRSIAA
jgi:cystine transport system substrate-binding protein